MRRVQPQAQRRSWNSRAVVASVATGVLLLVAAFCFDPGAALMSALTNVGTTFLLVAVLVLLEGLMVRDVTDQVMHTVSEMLQSSTPRLTTPAWVAASPIHVKELEQERPLDVSPLLSLAEAFSFGAIGELTTTVGTPAARLAYDHMAIEALRAAMTAHIVARQVSTPLTDSQEYALRSVGDYLRGARPIAIAGGLIRSAQFMPPEFEPHDVVILTGAAGPYVRDRVAAGLALLHRAPATSRIVMSGGAFAQFDGRRITEAEGMAEIAETMAEAEGLDISQQIVLEDRSLSFRENVLLSLDAIQTSAASVRRPLRIAFVTAPYSARRLGWIAEELLKRFKTASGIGAIGSIDIAHGQNNWDVDEVVRLGHGTASETYTDPAHIFARGIDRWLVEYFKLIGGRAVAEF